MNTKTEYKMACNSKNQSVQVGIMMTRLTFFLCFFLMISLKGWSQKDKVTDCPPSKLKIDNVYFKLDSLENKIDSIESHLNNFYMALSDSFISKAINKMNDDQKKIMEDLNNQIATSTAEKNKAIGERDALVLEKKSWTSEKSSMQNELNSLKKDNEAIWKTTAENLIKSAATAPAKLIDDLISKNSNDATLVSKLQTYKTQSDYLLAAQKLLLDGTDKSNYLTVKENLKKPFDNKFPEQIKLQSKLITELEIFEDVAIELNFVIEELKSITKSTIRTQEMEDQYKSARLIKFFPWLEQIFIANKTKHTPIGITFE